MGLLREIMVMTHGKKIDSLILLLAVLMCAGFLMQLSVVFQRPLNSDNVQQSMFVMDMAEKGNYLLKGWYVPENSYLLTEYPLYFVMESLFGSHLAVTKISLFLILLAGTLVFCLLLHRVFGMTAALAGGAVFLTGSVFSSIIVLYTPLSHFGTMIAALISFYAFLSLAGESASRFRRLAAYGVIFFVSLCAVFSDKLYLAVFVVPLFLTVMARKAPGVSFSDDRHMYGGLVVTGAAVAAAVILLEIYRHTGVHLMAVKFRPADGEKIFDNAAVYSQCIAAIVNFNFWEKGQVGISALFRIIQGLFSGIALWGLLVLFIRESDPVKRVTMLFFILSSFVLSAAFILSTFPSIIDTARYLVSIPFFQAFCAALIVQEGRRILTPHGHMSAVAVLVLLSLFNVFQGFSVRQQQAQIPLARYLESQNLRYGFSSYWYSNIVTFLSGGRVKVRAVRITKGHLTPCQWLCKDEWYDPACYEGPTFLMVPGTGTVNDHAGIYAMSPFYIWSQLGKPSEVKHFEDMDIYVWPRNIMGTLRKTVSSCYIPVRGEMPHGIGKTEQEGGSMILHSLKGEKGLLVGPLPFRARKGKYMLKFFASSEGQKGAVAASMAVLAHGGKKSETPVKAGGEWDEYALPFVLDDDCDAEIILSCTGKTDVKVGGMCLQQLR